MNAAAVEVVTTPQPSAFPEETIPRQVKKGPFWKTRELPCRAVPGP